MSAADNDSSFDTENFNPQKQKIATTKAKSTTTKAASPAKKATGGFKKKTVEETYQKKTQLEHILLRPDTYIGSTESVTQPMFILNADNNRIVQKDVTYTPGLYNIFDQIVVNAADNKQRDPSMDRMEVTVDADTNTNTISVLNNGKGIPVVMNNEYDCYVPTLIFGRLLNGSNFDDAEKKTTGGRNGYGAKLANIFSTEFVVECLDSENEVKFTQVFRDNMHVTEVAKVKKATKSEIKKGDYTKITFKPDLARFGMTSLDADTVGLLSKRAYDIAGSMANKEGKKLSVYLNGKKLPVEDFNSYLGLFDGITPPVAFEKVNDRWEVGVGISEGSLQQISFVNANPTTNGGGHVNHIADQVVENLLVNIRKKKLSGGEIEPNQIKSHLAIYVNCLVENPTFDSKTKENLTTKPSTFSSVKLSDKFLKAVEKSGVVDSIMIGAKRKKYQALKLKGGPKKTKLTDITKLDDAIHADTAKSKDCTVIITKGDSAKSLAMSGLSVVGRDYYGVYELSTDHVTRDDDDEGMEMDDNAINTGAGLIEMAFSKSKVEDRKKWLSAVDNDTFLNYSEAQQNGINYSDFINRELILFSQYGNIRSIPHLLNGFKPSCFKKKLKNEIKVAQLAGYIGEHTAYHHGDMSLNGTIIGMAQSYAGSNSQFCTRRMGGKDHASARYIFTRPEKITRTIFHPDDDVLLNYLNDDDLSIEPEYYMPVIPMVLINGSDGIGTGYSSTIQNHDPREVITNLRRMINGDEPEVNPHFSRYTGEITAEIGKRDGSYSVKGKIEHTNETTLCNWSGPNTLLTHLYSSSSYCPKRPHLDTKLKQNMRLSRLLAVAVAFIAVICSCSVTVDAKENDGGIHKGGRNNGAVDNDSSIIWNQFLQENHASDSKEQPRRLKPLDEKRIEKARRKMREKGQPPATDGTSTKAVTLKKTEETTATPPKIDTETGDGGKSKKEKDDQGGDKMSKAKASKAKASKAAEQSPATDVTSTKTAQLKKIDETTATPPKIDTETGDGGKSKEEKDDQGGGKMPKAKASKAKAAGQSPATDGTSTKAAKLKKVEETTATPQKIDTETGDGGKSKKEKDDQQDGDKMPKAKASKAAGKQDKQKSTDLKSKASKSKASKDVDIQRDVAFLGIETAYSVFRSDLTLIWEPPLCIPSICSCGSCVLKSGKESKSSGKASKSSPSSTSSKEISSSKSSPIRQLSFTDGEYVTEGVLYHVFVRKSPFDFFEEDFETLIASSAKETTISTNITITDLIPGIEYTAFVLATIDDVILPNQNNVTITISTQDPVLSEYVDPKTIPSDFTVTREVWYEAELDQDANITSSAPCVNGTTTDNETCAVATCGGIEEDDSNFTITVFNVTICDGPVASWDFNISTNDTIIYTNTSQDGDEERIMHVWEVLRDNDTCVEVSAVDSSFTYLFDKLDLDSQHDPYYYLARENIINNTCAEYCESNQRVRRMKGFEKEFTVASLSVLESIRDSGNKCAWDKKKSGNSTTSVRVCGSYDVKINAYLKARAYLRIKVKISSTKFSGEIGGGYDYLAGFDAKAMAKVSVSLKGKGDIGKKMKKKIKTLFVIFGVPVFFSYRPYVKYDWSMEYDQTNEFKMGYEVSGGDYGGVVISSSKGVFFKNETKPLEQTDVGDIMKFEDDECELEVEAELGVRVGIVLRLFDNKGLETDLALRAGVEANSKFKCDGSLSPTSDLYYGNEEPEETKELTAFPGIPFRQTRFDIDFALTLPISVRLGIHFDPCFGVFGGCGIWVIKIKVKFEIDILTVPLVTLPQAQPEKGEYDCKDNGLELSVSAKITDGDGFLFTNEIKDPKTFVLVFNNTSWSSTPKQIYGEQGTMVLNRGVGSDPFCCGAADVPPNELFLLTTPSLLPFENSLLSYDEYGEDCSLIETLEGCALDQFYQDAIGDMVCENENCNWKVEKDSICKFDGVVCYCDDVLWILEIWDIPEVSCDCQVAALKRNGKHKMGGKLSSELFGSLEYGTKYLENLVVLDLSFDETCANETELSCLNATTVGLNETCLLANCDSPQVDITNGTNKCWKEDDSQCHFKCANGGLNYTNQTICTERTERQDDEKLQGAIPSEMWVMEYLCYVDLSGNLFDGFENDSIPDLPDHGRYSIDYLDLRNNNIKGDLPCDICDSFNKDENKEIIVDCLGDTPMVNCRCCYSDHNKTSCSNSSITNHEKACPSPSEEPSMSPSISSKPSASAAPSDLPSTSTEPSIEPTPSPTSSSEPSIWPTVTSFPSTEPSRSSGPTPDCEKESN